MQTQGGKYKIVILEKSKCLFQKKCLFIASESHVITTFFVLYNLGPLVLKIGEDMPPVKSLG